MGRPNQPWYRASSDVWVTKIAGRQYTLCRGKANRKQAMKSFHTLMASLGRVEAAPGDLGIGALADHFLDAAETRVGPLAFGNYRHWLTGFRDFVGTTRLVSKLTPHDITKWLEPRVNRRGKLSVWSSSTCQSAITTVKSCLAWGIAQGIIMVNPLRHVKGPGYEARDVSLTPAQIAIVLDATKGGFHALLEFLWVTGCRPSEAMRLEATHCDLATGLARLSGKATKKTRRLRTIYLTDRAIEILKARIKLNPEGPLFTNVDRVAWTFQALHGRLRRLRKRLNMGHELTVESFRHSFATDGALRLKPLVLAELMGHASTKILEKFYVNLSKRAEEMRAAAFEVRSPAERPAVEPPD